MCLKPFFRPFYNLHLKRSIDETVELKCIAMSSTGDLGTKKAGNMQYSKSAEILQSRLIAEVKGGNKSSAGLTVRPRMPTMQNSKSTPHVGISSSPELLNELLPSPLPRTIQERDISNSKSFNPKQSSMAITNSNQNNLMTGFDSQHETKSLKMSGSLKKETKLINGIDYASYGVDKHGFVASLNLSAKQFHDLFKVPQTFFYLAQRQPDEYASEYIAAQNHSDIHSESGSISLDTDYSVVYDARNYSISVYDLKAISLDQVDKNHYFTLSKEGITQFRNKISTFTSLAQWEREFKLYHKIANIQFFKLYKRWKVYNFWLYLVYRG